MWRGTHCGSSMMGEAETIRCSGNCGSDKEGSISARCKLGTGVRGVKVLGFKPHTVSSAIWCEVRGDFKGLGLSQGISGFLSGLVDCHQSVV